MTLFGISFYILLIKYIIKGVNLIKRKLIITIIFTFVILSSNITIAKEIDNYNDNLKETGISQAASVIIVQWNDIANATLPIAPFQETRAINLTIKYSITTGSSFLTKLFLQLLKGRKVDIKLNILSKPDWCTVRLLADTISTAFTGEEQNFTTQLLVTVNDKAPAYELGQIILNISTPDIKGKFGKITFVQGFKDTIEFNVKASYAPKLNVIAEESNLKISPFKKIIIPINITNLGNGQTKVITEIENASKNWETNITNYTILDIGQTETIYLTIKTDNNYKQAVIILKYTPAYTPNPEIKGVTEQLSIFIENDGSYKKANSGLGVIIIPLIIAIIIILLIIVFILKIKQKKK